MKRTLLLLAALCTVPAAAALAQDHHRSGFRLVHVDDSPARIAPRHAPREARFAMTTTGDAVSLLLTRDAVALQLTDRTLREIRHGNADDGDDSVLGRIVGDVVRRSVSTMLRRSVEYPIRDLRDVEYRGGRLVFTARDGERIFEDVQVNGSNLMESFTPADAQRFVREFRALKARAR